MTDLKMSIEGIEQAKAKLTDLDNKVQRTIIRKGARAGLKPMLAEAKALAPKQSGLLAQSIKLRSGGNKKGISRFNIGVAQKDFQGPAWYGAAVIYGHKQGKRSLGDARKLVQGNNFLLKAYEATASECIQIIGDTWLFLIEGEMK